MWDIVQLSEDHTEWNTIRENISEQQLSAARSLYERDQSIFIVPSSEYDLGTKDPNAIMDDLLRVNFNPVLRMTTGLAPGLISTTENCGGCFCVVYNDGRRQCETYYCVGPPELPTCFWFPCLGSTC